MNIISLRSASSSPLQRVLVFAFLALTNLLRAQTTSVVEWNFTSSTSPWSASVKNSAVMTSPVTLSANGTITASRVATAPTYAAAGTVWAGTEDTGFTAVRTSLTPRNAKSLSTTFTLTPQANGDWSSLAVAFAYQRSGTAPNRARAVLTWQEGATIKRRYTSSITLSGSAWTNTSALLQTGDTLPTTLASLPCLLEVYFWGNSTTPNNINLDDLKLRCNSLSNVYALNPGTLNAWSQNRAYSAQFTVPGFVGAVAWSVTGALPTGLTLNTSTGEISGTPTTVGAFTFTLAATGTGLSASKTYTLNIAAPPTALPAGNSLAKLSFDADTTATTFGSPPAGDVATCFTEFSFGYEGSAQMNGSIHAGGTNAGSATPINAALGGMTRGFYGWDASNVYTTTRNNLLHFNTGTSPRFNVFPAANSANIPTASQTGNGENAVWQSRIKLDPNASGDLKSFYFEALRWKKDDMTASGVNGPRWAELHAYWTNDSGTMQRWDSGAIDITSVYLPEHRAVNQFGRYVVDLDNGATGLNQRIKSTTDKYRTRTVFFDLYVWHDTGADLSGLAGANPPVILVDEFGVLGNFTCAVPKMGIGNTVFNDTNYNGRFDAGEGIAGVKVELLDASNTVLQSTITTSGGNYLFSNLAEGSYKVRIPASEFSSGKALFKLTSITGAGGDNGTDDGSDENGIDDAAAATNGIYSSIIALSMDSEPTTTETGNNTSTDSADDDNTDLTVDFGFIASPLFCVGDRVFKDANGSGKYDPGEGLDGISVQLLNSSNTLISSQTTANDGRYFFSPLPSNQTYYVRVAASNFGIGGPLDGWVSVTGNGVDDGVNHDDNGIDDTAAITNGIKSALITPDANQGGTFSYSWPPSAGMTGTNEGGTWYQVTAKNNYVTKLMDVSVTLDTTTQNTQALWMVIDNGVTPASADTNYAALYLANGVVTVTPYTANPTSTHTLGTIITTTPYTVTNIGTKRTFKFTLNTALVNQWAAAPATWLGTGFPYDAQGGYPDPLNKKVGLWIRSFSDGSAVLSGNTWTVTYGTAGDPNVGTYDDVTPLTEIGCDNTLDFGFQQSNDFGDFSTFASASSSVFNLLRLGALADAEAAATTNGSASGDDTNGIDDEDGATVPAVLSTGSSVSIPVSVFNNSGAVAYLNAWIDFNNDGALNDTLLSSGGEKLMAEQTVSSSATAQTVNVTFTVPVGASVGANRGIRIRLTSVSAPTPFGYKGFGEVEDYAASIAVPNLSIGNLVWNDANNNGLKDATELGIGGATVQLFASGADNTVNTADDVQVGANVTTGVTGAYSFSSLSPGKYFIKVTPPAGYPVTSGTPATTDNNVDSNNDGAQPGGAGTALFSSIIDLASGAESITDGDTDANTNMTVDFGLFTGFTVGNLVFNDANNNGTQDVGESGIAGVSVELLNGTTNAVLAATTTNASGLYSFLVYAPGSYKVRVTPTATYPLVSSAVGTDNGTDNNNDGTQPGGVATAVTSFAFTLAANTEPGTTGTASLENTIDFGLRAPVTDFGDYPAFASASQTASPNIRIGNNPTDSEATNPTSGAATADNTLASNDEDLVLPSVAIGGVTTFKFPVSVSGASTAATIAAWADWNGDGDVLDANEALTIAPSTVSAGTTTVTVTFSPPVATVAGTKYVRFRIQDGAVAPAFSGASNAIGEVEDYAVTASVPTLDFGDYIDLPDASSTLLSSLKIGSALDAELVANKNGVATGDDLNATDDEDGVTFSTFTPGQAATITVTATNSSGATAYLNAWADWNEDGDLADSGETLTSVSPATQITVATSATINRTFTFNFTVPATARGAIPVRIRLTSVSSPGPDGQDGNGEVEDHLVTLATTCASQLAIYNAIISNNLSTPSDIQGRSVIKTIVGTDSFSTGHLVTGASTVAMAVQTGFASAGGPINMVNGSLWAPNLAALNGRAVNYPGGGSLLTSPAFDFATVFNSIAAESVTYAAMPTNSTITIPSSGPAPTYLTVGSGVANGTPAVFSIDGNTLFHNNNVQTIDLNLNGKTPSAIIINITGTSTNYDWSGENVNVLRDTTLRSKILWHFPSATSINLGKPLYGSILAPNATLTATGGANEGSVMAKNYTGTIAIKLPLWLGGSSVCSDASDFGDSLLFPDASSTAVTTIKMGANAGDVDTAFLANSTANGDDNNGTDDEDGVTFGILPQAGTGTITVNVTNTSGAVAYLNGWIDWNNNGVLTDSGEQVIINVSVATGTSATNQVYSVNVPSTAATGQHGARFRFTSTNGPGPTDYSGNGEVEDYLATVSGPNTDFGDFDSFGAASSITSTTLKLGGNAPDGEASAITNSTATGDDTNAQDDEDGVSLPASMTQGSTYSITVNVNNTSGAATYLSGWIDWNNDGVLTGASELIVNNVSIANGVAGNQTYSVTVPGTATVGTVGARFRITSTSAPGSTGASGTGEVEDYLVTVAAATGCYAVDGTSTIYRFDTATGTYGSVTTAPFNIQAVTFDAVKNRVYYVEKAATAWRVGYYSVATNTHTTLTNGLTSGTLGMAMPAQPETLVFWANSLLIINPTTTASTLLRVDMNDTFVLDLNETARIDQDGDDRIGLAKAATVDANGVMYFATTTEFSKFDLKTLDGYQLITAAPGATWEALGFNGATLYGVKNEASPKTYSINTTTGAFTAGPNVTSAKNFTDIGCGATQFALQCRDGDVVHTLTDCPTLVKVNLVTGHQSVLTEACLFPARACAYDPIQHAIFYTENSSGSPQRLGKYDLTTYTHTNYGDLMAASFTTKPTGLIDALTWFNGKLYYVNTNTDDLIAITTLGSTISSQAKVADIAANARHFGIVSGLAIDGASNLFITSTGSSFFGKYNIGSLSGYTQLSTSNASMESLAFNPTNGVLYGVSSANIRDLMLVNTATGALTDPAPADGFPGLRALLWNEMFDMAPITCTVADHGDFSSFVDASSSLSAGLKMGAGVVDSEFSAITNATATGDDSNGTDDEDGVTLPSMPQASTQTITVNLTNTTGAVTYLNGWIDWNNNGVLTDAGEQVIANVAVANGVTGQNQTFSVNVPATAPLGTIGARFRLTSTSAPASTGPSGAGEVEDYALTVVGPTDDFGDAPASYGIASHTASPTVGVGLLVDTEVAQTSNATATGDDLLGSPNDEDGVFTDLPLVPGRDTALIISTRGNGFLNAWMDFNRDGDFSDAGEQIATNQATSTTTSSIPDQASPALVEFTVPASAVPGTSFVRVRMSSGSLASPFGAGGVGEVEDVAVTILSPASVSGRAWADFNSDGIRSGASEVGVPGIIAILYRNDGKVEATTVTNGTGDYLFSALPPDSYYVKLSLASGYSLSPALQGSDTTLDSDFVVATAQTATFALAAGSTKANLDAGLLGTVGRLSVCAVRSPSTTNWANSFVLGKFDPALGTLTGVEVRSVANYTHDILIESFASGGGTADVTWTRDINLTLPNASVLAISNSNVSNYTYATFDDQMDYRGASGIHDFDSTRTLATAAVNYATISDFLGTASGQTLSLAGSASVSTVANTTGGNSSVALRTKIGDIVCITYSYSTGPAYDYGDHIFGSFAASSAAQVVSTAIKIGTNATDSEASDPSDSAATKDDGSGVNDEDLTMPSFTVGSATNLVLPISVTPASLSGGTARVNVFVDWNGDGDVLDTNESLAVQTVAASGNYTFSLTPPAATLAGPKYLRVRITEGATAPTFSGSSALKGEVEDYSISVGVPGNISVGNLVWADTNQNGVKDVSESGIDGITIQLLKNGTQVASTVTAGGGLYSFSVAPGTGYSLNIPTPPAAYPFGFYFNDYTDNGVDNDANGYQPAGAGTATWTGAFDLTSNGEPGTSGTTNSESTWDFGFRAVPNPVSLLEYNLEASAPTVNPSVKNSCINTTSPLQLGSGLTATWNNGTAAPIRPGLKDIDVGGQAGSYNVALEAARTSLSPTAQTLYTTITFAPGASGTIGNGYLDICPSGTPDNVRFFLTWFDGTVYRTAWTNTGVAAAAVPSNPTFWVSLDLPFVNGTPLPTGAALAGKTFLLEVAIWGSNPTLDNIVLGGTCSLPSSGDYGDWNGSGAATVTTSSTVNTSLRMGALVDSESSVTPNATATADGADEDGVTLPATIVAGTSVSIPVRTFNNTGSTAYIQGWIDFNNDGTFNNVDVTTAGGERVYNASFPSSISQQLNNVTFTVPATASVGAGRGVRFRFSNSSATTPISSGAVGEIEDYVVAIANTLDFGDAPDTGAGYGANNYQATLADNGPRHGIISSLYMGAAVPDAEATASPNGTASGDDTSGSDDENGVTSALSFTRLGAASAAVTVTNNTGMTARLFGWIDFNGDGWFSAAERADITVPTGTNAASVTLDFGSVPYSAAASTFARFRLSTDSTAGSPVGNAGDGEVEDYPVSISGSPLLCYIDVPTSSQSLSLTTAASASSVKLDSGAAGGERDVVLESTFGSWNINTAAYTTSGIPAFDFSTGAGDGLRATYTWDGVDNDAATTAFGLGYDYSAPEPFYLELGADNHWTTSTPSAIVMTLRVYSTATNWSQQQITFQRVSSDSGPGTSAAIVFPRAGFVTGGGAGVNWSNVGAIQLQVEHLNGGSDTGVMRFMGPCRRDYGDWSGSGAATDTTYAKIDSNLYMGATVDNEVSVTPDFAATADGSDEDGATLPSTISQGENISIPVKVFNNTGSTAYLSAWIDFNNDGSFNNLPMLLGGERLELLNSVPTSATPTTENIAFKVPSSAVTGPQRGVRFRLSDQLLSGPTGASGIGEIEDYVVNIGQGISVGNLVWNDANNNGIKDGAEAGMSGAVVVLLNSSTGVTVASTTSDSSGNYAFSSVAPGTYKVRVTPSAAYPLATTAVGSDNGTDNNNDGTQPGASGTASTSFAFIVDYNTEPGTTGATSSEDTIDFGFHACPTITIAPASLAAGTAGSAYSATVTASGGTSPYTYTLSSGTLPGGLTLGSASGVISGTPSAAGASSFTVQAKDSAGCIGTQSVALTIGGASSFDYGDYSKFANANSSIAANIRLGATVDAEATAATNITATADDSVGSDDEDGVWFPVMRIGYKPTIALQVTNTSGANAYLNGWIDYNDNGLFDVGEQVIVNQTIASGLRGNDEMMHITLPPIPATALLTGPIGARFRLTSTSNPGPTGVAGSGEVEDYTFTVEPACTNVLLNPSFEAAALADGSTVAALSNWTGTAGSTGTHPFRGVLADGYQAAWVTAPVGSTDTVYQDIAVPLGGYAYELTYNEAMHEPTLNFGEVRLQYLDATDTPLGGTSTVSSRMTWDMESNTPARTFSPLRTLTLPVAPAGATKVRVSIYFEHNDAAADYAMTDVMCLNPISPPLSIGNLVWNDCNNDGVKQATEVGVANALVTLYSPGTDNLVNTADDVQVGAQQLTTATGAYLFSNLQSGTYFVKIVPPGTYWSSGGTPVTVSDATDDDNNGAQPGGVGTALFSPKVVLSPATQPTTEDSDANTNLTIDFGMWPGFEVGNLVWNDQNNNGLKDASEIGVDGVTVSLMTPGASNNVNGNDATVVQTVVTDASGIYSLRTRTAGTYFVRVTPLTGYELASSAATNADNGVDNDNNGTQNGNAKKPINSPIFTLAICSEPGAAGTTNFENTIDFGLRGCPTITVTPNSLPYAYANQAFTAQMVASGGTPPYTWAVVSGYLPSGITLDPNTGLISGVSPPDPVVIPLTIEATDAKDCKAQSSGLACVVFAMQLGSHVWNDVNCNGLKDGSEPGIGGVTIQLYQKGPDGVAYTADDVKIGGNVLSAADGSYSFSNLVPGDYWVKVLPSAAYPNATATVAFLDNSIDNDNNGAQPLGGGTAIRSPLITLTPNAETTAEDGDNNSDMTVDFGLRPGFSVGDLVWKDDNNNGIKDPTEGGLAGLSVNLMSPGADGLIGGTDDTVIMTSSTNALGNYLFSIPVAGKYFVRLSTIAGYEVPSGPVTITDNGVDNDNNGSQPGGPGTYVYSPVFQLGQCLEPGPTGTTNSELTIDIGLVPSNMAIGNVVFEDIDGNGHFDAGEGLDGLTVQLYASTQTPGVDTPLASMTTANGGRYLFEQLTRRSYIVHLPKVLFGATGRLRAMFSIPGVQADGSDDDLGEDTVDALDPTVSGISTRVVNLDFDAQPTDATTETGFDHLSDNVPASKDNDFDLTIDLGVYRRVGIGNLVFFDTNGNGHADTGEGLNGVTVELYHGSQVPGSDTPLATTLTANGGKYLFKDLQPGLYVVHLPKANFQSGGQLAGRMSIAQGQFGDDDVGEDGLNDRDPPSQGVSCNPIFLQASTCPTSQNGETGIDSASDDDIDAAIDLTIDFGFQNPVAVGNLVFYDANANGHYDTGEGVDGVTVEIYRSGAVGGSSIPMASVVTANGGHYVFDQLAGGTYFVHIPSFNFVTDAPLFERISISGTAVNDTDDNVGEDGLDTGAPVVSGISSRDFTLTAGSMPENSGTETGFNKTEDDANSQDSNGNMTIDFGFVPPDPNRVGLGNAVFNDLNGNARFDEGEGVDGVDLDLYNATTNVKVSSTTSSGGGCYFFGNLAPGSYYVKIPASNWNNSKPLNGKLPLPGQGGDNQLDDDLDENGDDPANPASTGVRSTNITLAAGAEPTDFDTEAGKNTYVDFGVDDNNDLTVDFGFYERCGVGNLVFVDANSNGKADSNEGVAGVTVKLFRAGDDPLTSTPVATQVTESTRKGFFLFLGMKPGYYFMHLPAAMFQSGGPLFGKISMTGVETSPVDDSAGEDGIDPADIAQQGVSTDLFLLKPGAMPSTGENGQFGSADNSTPDGISGYNIDLTRGLRIHHECVCW